MKTTLRVVLFASIVLSLVPSLVACAEPPRSSSDTAPISVAKFVKDLQLLARRNPPGRTQLEKEDTLVLLRRRIKEQFDGQVLKFSARIIKIDWKPDAATIRIASPVPKHRPSKGMPFRLTAVTTYALAMSRDEAMALSSRKPLVLKARFEFVDHDFGSIRPPTMSLFSLRSEDYRLVPTVGVFVTEEYSIAIGDDELLRVRPDPIDLNDADAEP